jgi:hypothetical protein
MSVQDETNDGQIYNVGKSRWKSELAISSWQRSFVFFPKRSMSGETIRAFTYAYTRTRDTYAGGQVAENIDWLTPHEYLMEVLREDS